MRTTSEVLTEGDGNAMNIMARVSQELRDRGHGEKAPDYRVRAMSGDYDNLIKESREILDATEPEE